MIRFCNSKINIGLDIVARRPDGYHDIVTAMFPIGWGDILEIVPSADGVTRLTVTGRRVDCPAEKNLVMKAYRALAAEVELPAVDIYLRKIVPDGAGLGGGSSDAAHTLLLLNDLFALGLPLDRLAAIAAGIGADCPFFVYDTPMLATGTGIDLTPVEMPCLDGLTIVVVKPPVSVPTAAAYKGVTPRKPSVQLLSSLRRPIKEWRGLVENDFEPSVFRQYPLIAEAKADMYDSGAVYASMSGSGSAVYGLFECANLSLPDRWMRDGWQSWRGVVGKE